MTGNAATLGQWRRTMYYDLLYGHHVEAEIHRRRMAKPALVERDIARLESMTRGDAFVFSPAVPGGLVFVATLLMIDGVNLVAKDPSENPASIVTIHTTEIEPGSVRLLFPRVRRLSPQEVSRCN